MSKESEAQFQSKAIYREETLYYDLGYRFAQYRGRKPQKALNLNLSGYILVTSLILQFGFNIQQWLTLIVIGILFIYQSFIQKGSNQKASTIILILLLTANILDHISGGIEVKPGKLFDTQLSPIVWLLELIWVILFGIHAIIILQPHTPLLSDGISIQPETKTEVENYKQLVKRLEGTDFRISQLDNLIDIRGLKSTLQNTITYVVGLLGLAIILDIILWRVVGSFGGGVNILEEYFISGMALILFLLLIVFSGIIFPQKEIIDEDEDQ